MAVFNCVALTPTSSAAFLMSLRARRRVLGDKPHIAPTSPDESCVGAEEDAEIGNAMRTANAFSFFMENEAEQEEAEVVDEVKAKKQQLQPKKKADQLQPKPPPAHPAPKKAAMNVRNKEDEELAGDS